MSYHSHAANSPERSGASWGVVQIIIWQLIFAAGFFFGIYYTDLIRLF
ncbi:hypothetical protein [Vibrio vulnificus]